MGALENIGLYKFLSQNKDVKCISQSVPEQNILNWKNDEQKIPVIILEEKYSQFGGTYHQNLSGLNIIYNLRESLYGGPIVVLSIFNEEQVKKLIRKQPNRFNEKTERILHTSNIGFFQVLNTDWSSKATSFILANKKFNNSRFSIKDVIRYSTKHSAAVENILHNIKNAFQVPQSDDRDKAIESYLFQIKMEHIKSSAISDFNKAAKELFKSEDVDNFKEKIQPLIFQEKEGKEENVKFSIHDTNWQVLVVEDEMELAKKIKKGLVEEGFIVECAYTPHEALTKIDNLNNLVWVISDYRLYDENSNWQTLQGIDLLQEIEKKVDGDFGIVPHLTILTSKRDIINRSLMEDFKITFFNKDLLTIEEEYRIFIDTQLSYLVKVASTTENKFIPPASWKRNDNMVLTLNTKNWREFYNVENKNYTQINDLIYKFNIKYPDEYDNASWESIWKRISSEEDWEQINKDIEEYILNNFRQTKFYTTASLRPKSKYHLKKNNWKSVIKDRLLIRRACLAAFVNYEESKYAETFIKPLDLFNAFMKESFLPSVKGNSTFNQIRASIGFDPDEVFKGFEFQDQNIPLEEREFIKKFKKMISS